VLVKLLLLSNKIQGNVNGERQDIFYTSI